MNHGHYGVYNKHITLVLSHRKLAIDKPLTLQARGLSTTNFLCPRTWVVYLLYTPTCHGLHNIYVYIYIHYNIIMYIHICHYVSLTNKQLANDQELICIEVTLPAMQYLIYHGMQKYGNSRARTSSFTMHSYIYLCVHRY